MWTTWENLLHHVGKIHGHDVSNELHNNKTVVNTKPEHTQNV